MVDPDSDKISRVPSYSGYLLVHNALRYETFTLFGRPSQTVLLTLLTRMKVLQPLIINNQVWAISRSLAATSEISIDFFSSRYLDVSVPSVSSTWLVSHHAVTYISIC